MSHSERVAAAGPHPDRPTRAWLTLAACRERLRAVVALLAPGGIAMDPIDTSANRDQRGPPAANAAYAAYAARDAALIRDLRAAERAYDELIAVITHEVKTPLTVIRGHAQLTARALRRGDPIDPAHLLETMALIDASAIRIAAELDDLVEDSPPDAV